MQGWHYGKGLIYYTTVLKISTLHLQVYAALIIWHKNQFICTLQDASHFEWRHISPASPYFNYSFVFMVISPYYYCFKV